MALVRVEPTAAPHVARVVLDRPHQRNAVSRPMLQEIGAAFGDLATDPDLRAVILSGEGPDFCAGADLSDIAMAQADVDYGRSFEEVVQAIISHPSPVIAEVHGAALGAGCQLAVACDLAIAADDSRLGIPAARLGLVINYENVERLVLAIGRKHAGELLYSGRVVSGTEAAGWGMVNDAVPRTQLRASTEKLAGRIAELAPLSVRGSKRGIQIVMERSTLHRAVEGFRAGDFDMMAAEALASQDLREGIEAFSERRPPRFEGK